MIASDFGPVYTKTKLVSAPSYVAVLTMPPVSDGGIAHWVLDVQHDHLLNMDLQVVDEETAIGASNMRRISF